VTSLPRGGLSGSGAPPVRKRSRGRRDEGFFCRLRNGAPTSNANAGALVLVVEWESRGTELTLEGSDLIASRSLTSLPCSW
jgi:hypothetical protein